MRATIKNPSPLSSSWRIIFAFLLSSLYCGDNGVLFVHGQKEEPDTFPQDPSPSVISPPSWSPPSLFGPPPGITIEPLIPAQAAKQAAVLPTSISGHAFFDSSDDGTRDVAIGSFDYAIGDVPVFLFTCTNELIATTKTDLSGVYTFEELNGGGQYYISPKPPSYYMFTAVWNGKTDENGVLMYPDVESAVDPETGQSVCFELVAEEGEEEKDVSFGMKFFVASPPTTPVTPKPTVAPTPMVVDPPAPTPALTSGPTASAAVPVTLSPTEEPSASPSKSPSISPSKSPSLNPTTLAPTLKPTLSPTLKPSLDPTFNPTTFSPSNRPTITNSTSPSSTPSHLPSMTPSSSTSPSLSPSALFSDNPSGEPSMMPSESPSLNPTSSAHPTAMPSAPPSRSGDLYGPTVTERLVMSIRGIEVLEDEDAWRAVTSNYIMAFFNRTNDDPGVFDVTMSIEVTRQTSSNATLNVFNRKRQLGQRQLQAPKNVAIIYDQTSSYKTTEPEKYDDVYVATTPFVTRQGGEDYIKALRKLSPYYNDITSVGSVRTNPEDAPTGFELGRVKKPDVKDDNNTIYIIVGAVCGGAVLVAALVLIALRRRKKRREEYLEPVGNGPPSSMVRRMEDDLENGTSSNSEFENEISIGPSTIASEQSGRSNRRVNSSSRRPNSNSSSRHNNSSSSRHNNSSSSHMSRQSSTTSVDIDSFTTDAVRGTSRTNTHVAMIHVIAPAGKLGVIVDVPPSGGPAFVCEIKDTCPIIGEIHLEDKIIAVDDEDVQRMTAVNVSKLLARKSHNEERKITVLREVDEDFHNSGGVDVDDMSTEEEVYHDDEEGSTTDTDASSSILPMTKKPTLPKTEQMDIIAPSGKLGIVLVTPEPPASPGPAYVFNIRDDSPLVGNVHLGDKIIAVDGDNVSKMTAINVSKLLGSKSSYKKRKITVLREVGSDVGDGGEEERATSSTAVSDDTEYTLAQAITASTTEDAAPPLLAAASSSTQATEATATTTNSSETKIKTTTIDIIAPAGKLGVVVDSPPEGGSAYVSDIKVESHIFGKINLGDRIISVDGEDVSKLKAIHVSMLLGSKSRNAKRTITVLRDVDNDDEGEPSYLV